jgi:hypothetical protein
MKSVKLLVLLVFSTFMSFSVAAQCSICTKTAQQLGDEAARGLNGGILYLAAAPLLIVGFIAYRWWRNNR